MTPGERTNPKIINGSRRARIANGSGVTVMDVNQLLNRFAEAQKMMKQMGGMMGLPGGAPQGDQVAQEQAQGHARAAAGPRGGGCRPACPAGAAACPQLPPGFDPARRAARAWRRSVQGSEARLRQAHQGRRQVD